MPLRVGHSISDITQQSNGNNGSTDLKFQIDDNLLITPTAPAQFLSNDIYFENRLLTDSEYRSLLTSEESIADYDIGLVTYMSNWLYTRVGQTYQIVTKTAAASWAFRTWLYRRAGKYLPFWEPSFENDLRIKSVGAITTTIRFYRDSKSEWTPLKTHIAVQDTSGTWYARTLSAPSIIDATTIQYTLSSNLGIDASNVFRISYLGLKRLLSDNVSLKWVGNGICTCDLSVIEVSP